MNKSAAKLPSEDHYISIKEFCEKYGIGRTKAYELSRTSAFPRIKIGKAVRIAEGAAHEFMLQQANGTRL